MTSNKNENVTAARHVGRALFLSMTLAGGIQCGGPPQLLIDHDGQNISEESAALSACPPGTFSCGPGQLDGKPIPQACCNLPPVTGTVSPVFHITHVVYTPPGRSSSMNYTAGDTIGSTVSSTSSFKRDVSVSASAGIGMPFVNNGSVTVTAGQSWGSTDTRVTDLAVTTTNAYRKAGQVEWVDHASDEIWFLVSPKIDVSIYDKRVPKIVTWHFSPNQNPTPYFVYVGELMDPSTMEPGVKAFLDSVGITPTYYPELLKVDPWVADATYDPAQHPERFELVGQPIPYMGVRNPGDQASVFMYTTTRNAMNSSTAQSELSYSVGYSGTVGTGFDGFFKASLTVSDKFVWTNSTSKKDSTGTTNSNTVAIGQPGFGYAGWTVLRVYEDKIWKTFAFKLNPI